MTAIIRRKADAWPVPPVTADEAAELVGVCRRTLDAFLKEEPIFERRGRKRVFYPEHIEEIRRRMHECASESSGRTVGRTSMGPALMGGASAALSKLVTLSERRKQERTKKPDYGR